MTRRGDVDRAGDEGDGTRWHLLYAAVLAELGILVALFYALTWWASA